MSKSMVLLCSLLFALPAAARPAPGSLSGTVQPEGTAPEGSPPFLVYLVGFSEKPDKKAVRIALGPEKGVPELIPVMVGQSIDLVNSSKRWHGPYWAENAKIVSAGQLAPGKSRRISFKHAGVYGLYCNIHPDEAHELVVLPNRAFALAGASGKYRITNVPAGKWTVYVYNGRWNPQSKQVQVKAGKAAKLDFTVPQTLLGAKARPAATK